MKKPSQMAEISEIIELIANPLNTANLILSVVSFFINSFHLIVLTRKSICSSSTNWLMIGIAISDIATLFLTVEKHLVLLDIERDECVTSDSLLGIYIGVFSWALQDFFRRCSTWLALLMAIIRILIIRNALDKKLSKPSFGRFLVALIFVFASIPSVFYYLRFQVLENSRIPLPISCDEFQDIDAFPKYRLQLITLFRLENQLVLRVYLMVNAVISKFLPCLCFPPCTFLLIRALRSAKNKSNVSSTDEKSDPTTKLVILVTIAFFLAEAPLGIIITIQAFFHKKNALITASVDTVSVFTCLLTINSTLHFFMCVFLSRQYRKTVKRLLKWEKFEKMVGLSKNRVSKETRHGSSFMVRLP